MAAKRFIHVDQFTSDALKFAGLSATGAALGAVTNIDKSLGFDVALTGAVLLVKGGRFGDRVSLQVVHPAAGVLEEFVTDWYVTEDAQKQFEIQLNYPANVPTGLILRVVYKADVDLDVARNVAINYITHRVIQQEA